MFIYLFNDVTEILVNISLPVDGVALCLLKRGSSERTSLNVTIISLRSPKDTNLGAKEDRNVSADMHKSNAAVPDCVWQNYLGADEGYFNQLQQELPGFTASSVVLLTGVHEVKTDPSSKTIHIVLIPTQQSWRGASYNGRTFASNTWNEIPEFSISSVWFKKKK